jgi:hypothetical protein
MLLHKNFTITQEFKMRRLILPALLTLSFAPGLALAQQDNSAAPPPPPGADMPPPGGPDMPPPPPGGWKHGEKHHDWKKHEAEMEKKFQEKFAAANTTHDGHLTLAQAQAAKMRPIVDHFAEIDSQKLGYVTVNEVEAWRLDDMARHMEAMAKTMEQKAATLRAAQN